MPVPFRNQKAAILICRNRSKEKRFCVHREGQVYRLLQRSIGVESVKSIAEKYGGTYCAEVKDEMFMSSVLLNLRT